MKAFVMQGLGRVGFADKPVPKPGANDAIIKTTHALICTSDSHTVHGAIGPRENLTLGHEAVGLVQEVGGEVKLFKPGDRVAYAGGPLGAYSEARVMPADRLVPVPTAISDPWYNIAIRSAMRKALPLRRATATSPTRGGATRAAAVRTGPSSSASPRPGRRGRPAT